MVALCDNAIALFADCENIEVSHLDLTRLTTKHCSGNVVQETAGTLEIDIYTVYTIL